MLGIPNTMYYISWVHVSISKSVPRSTRHTWAYVSLGAPVHWEADPMGSAAGALEGCLRGSRSGRGCPQCAFIGSFKLARFVMSRGARRAWQPAHRDSRVSAWMAAF